MKSTKKIALILAVALICSMFAGCSLFDKTVLDIGGVKIPEKLYASAIKYTDAVFEQQMGFKPSEYIDQEITNGITGAQLLKEETDAIFFELAVVDLFAEEYGISLSAEERKELKESKKAQIESAGGKKAFIEMLEENGITEAFLDYFTERQSLSAKVYDELFTGDGKFALTAEETTEKLATIGYNRVKHVLVLAEAGAADFEEKKALAEDIAKRAKNGENFEELIATYGEDPGMESNPDGYILDKDGYTPDGSQMVAEFAQASNALAVDGVSAIVQSSYGFHIIKKYPFDAEYISANYETYSGLVASDKYSEEITTFSENVELKKTSNYDKINIHKLLGVEEKIGVNTGATEEEHSEDDGHDHSADAE